MRWVEEFDEEGRGELIPFTPKEGRFKHRYLRSLLIEGWGIQTTTLTQT